MPFFAPRHRLLIASMLVLFFAVGLTRAALRSNLLSLVPTIVRAEQKAPSTELSDAVSPASNNCAKCALAANFAPRAGSSAKTMVNAAASNAGSVLVFPYYTSTANGTKDTTISISNLSQQAARLHVFFVVNCSQVDIFASLDPGGCYVFSTADADPGVTGYLVVVAIDANGNPMQNNSLIGHAILKDGNYTGIYEAEVFRANSSTPATNNGNNTATLYFDGSRYDQMPNQFSVNIQSPSSLPGQKVITVGLQGNLNSPSGATQMNTGQITNSGGSSTNFSNFLLGACQALATISTTNPVVPGGLGNFLPSGQTGTLRFGIGGGIGLLLTPSTATESGRIQSLPKTNFTSATLTVSAFPPGFFTDAVAMSQKGIPFREQTAPASSAANAPAVTGAASEQVFVVKGSNPTPLPITGLRAGDTVYLEATLRDAKPGKNQQNRPLILQSSRGFSAQVDRYEIPTAFTYQMKADCEIFRAYIQNAGQTESASIKMRLKQKQRLSETNRNRLSSLIKTEIEAGSQMPLAPLGGGSGGSGGGSGGSSGLGTSIPLCTDSPVFESYEKRPPESSGFTFGTINIGFGVDTSGVIEGRPSTRIGDWRIRLSGTVKSIKTDVYSKIERGLSVGDQVRVRGTNNSDGTIYASEIRFVGATVCRRSLTYQIRGTTTVAANAVNNLSLDPPDPNFTVIAQPEIPEIPRLQAKEPLPSDPVQRQRIAAVINSYNAFIENQLLVIAYARAMFTSINRADGALEAGDTFWENKQVQAMERYQAQLAYLLGLQPTLRLNLHQALIAGGVVSLPVTSDDILRDQTEIANNGLPPLFIETLEALGADSEIIALVRAQIIVQKQEAATGFPDNLIQPDLLETLKTIAQELLPANFLRPDGAIIKTDVSLNLNVSSLSVMPGNNLIYTLAVENFGTETATNVILTAELPSNADFVSVVPKQGQCSKQGNSLTCEIPAMNAGARNEIQIIVRPTVEGNIIAKFHIAASQPDDNLFNNTVTSIVYCAVANTPVARDVCLSFGPVTVCFANVTAAGQTTVIPIQAAAAGSLPNGYTLNGLNLAFDITTTATFSGPVTITFNNVPVASKEVFAALRILHGEGNQLVDRTILAPDSPSPDFSTKTISTQVNSLSPFVLVVGPNAIAPTLSSTRAGSLLVFPYYTSNLSTQKDTRLTLTNAGTQQAIVHLFLVEGASCRQADWFLCLTPNATFSFKTSEYDPDNTGFVYAVTVDNQGRPIASNVLLGNAFVRDGDYQDNYTAEAFWRYDTTPTTVSNGVALLQLNGGVYDAAPAQFAVELQSPVDTVGQKIVVAPLAGDLTGSATLSATNPTLQTAADQFGAGLASNEQEKTVSFSAMLSGGCMKSAVLGTTFPRVPNGLGNLIATGKAGSLQFRVGAGVGLLMTPRTGANKWYGIRALHKTAMTNTVIAIPALMPVC